jgi:L-ribulose-5-phosphate 3-epimerase
MMMKGNDISLAQWSLVEEFRAGKWNTLDFPALARNDFNLNGVELVNTLFEVPTLEWLASLRQRANDHGVELVLIMVDDEGDGCSAEPKGRMQFAIQHRKWVDIAQYLGCHAIRTNCRGSGSPDQEEAWKWASESYQLLLEYASPAGMNILIENHGGLSDNANWLVSLMKKVNHPLFGTYPDWREPGPRFDNEDFLQKTLPYARGMSFRSQPSDAQTLRLIEMTRSAGYRGWYGIESQGREAIRKGKEILKRSLGIP